jgi:hypothetical protein
MTQQVQHHEAKAGRRKSLVRSVPIEDWPAADRRGWETACRRPRRLVRGGAASHLGADTRSDLARRLATIWISSIAQANLTLR